MTSTAPLVSVIIPAWNSQTFLAAAVASVRAQAYEPEIIIIDDGSTDDTPAVIDSLGPGIQRLSQPNRGPAAARNLGIKQAHGEFIAFLDADDLWMKDKLAVQLKELLADDHMDLIIGATQRVRAAQKSSASAACNELEPIGPVWMLLSLGASLFRRGVFGRVGMFDEMLRQGEDVDWFMRARESGMHIGNSNEIAQLYRIHENNMTRNPADKDHFFLTAMKRSLDRRRKGGAAPGELAPVDGIATFDPDTQGDHS